MKRGAILGITIEVVEGTKATLAAGDIWMGRTDDVAARIQRFERVIAELDDLVPAVSEALKKLCGDAETALLALGWTPQAGDS